VNKIGDIYHIFTISIIGALWKNLISKNNLNLDLHNKKIIFLDLMQRSSQRDLSPLNNKVKGCQQLDESTANPIEPESIVPLPVEPSNSKPN